MGADHNHDHTADTSRRRLAAVLGLVVLYMVAELVGGILSNSLALLADAGHMLSDAGALVAALLAMQIARRPASPTHTFGYRRAEVLAALGNGAALLAIAGYIAYEAIGRMGSPPEVEGPLMLGVAAGGLAVNLVGLALLHGGKSHSLNVRGAWLHVVADTLGSVGAIISGLLVTYAGWNVADPIASLVIASLVTWSAWSLIKQTTAVLMQAVPEGIDVAALEQCLVSTPGVTAAHDIHVWSITSGHPVLSAHLTVTEVTDRPALMESLRRQLGERFGIHHSTIQLDCPGACEPCTGETTGTSGP